jgi:two-component system LytT family sensor kinase
MDLSQRRLRNQYFDQDTPSPQSIPAPAFWSGRRLHLSLAVSFAIWGTMLLLTVTQASIRNPQFGWWATLVSWSPDFLVRALLTPAALVLSERILVAAPHAIRSLAMHGVLSALWSVLYVALHAAMILAFWPRAGRHADVGGFYTYLLSSQFLQGVLSYGAVVAVGHAFMFSHRLQTRQLESVKMRASLREAQLASLQRQINPHFLFNTLHTIGVLIDDKQADTAGRLLQRLSELLRSRLKADMPHEAPLSDELELLDSYLEIERARLGDRVRIDVEIGEQLQDALLPALFLQPLVENALHHGAAKREDGGRVRVQVYAAAGDTLRIEVTDNGPGTQDGSALRSGIALQNLRARLQQLHGAHHSMHAAGTPDGYRVFIELPLNRGRA